MYQYHTSRWHLHVAFISELTAALRVYQQFPLPPLLPSSHRCDSGSGRQTVLPSLLPSHWW